LGILTITPNSISGPNPWNRLMKEQPKAKTQGGRRKPIDGILPLNEYLSAQNLSSTYIPSTFFFPTKLLSPKIL
jgi:hypothetical protein